MAPNEAEQSSKTPRRTSSKYDFVKVKVWIGENSDHYYVLSRFLVSRMLTVTKISNVVAIKIALELKKLLVDNNLLDVSQADLEANLFKLMQKRGFGDEYVNRYKMMTNFHHQRVPLLVLVAGTACVGKSTIATQLAQRLNLPNVLQTDIIYELLRTDPNNAAPLNATPLWAQTDVTSTEDLMQEFRRECRVIRKGVDGDLTKTMSDGKPLIMEGLHLDPGIYLTELSQMGMKNPNRLKQGKVHPSEGLAVPHIPEKREVRGFNPVRVGANSGKQSCSAPGLGPDESGLSRGVRLERLGLRKGLGDENERNGAQSAELEKGRRKEVLTSASGSGRAQTRAGETADGFDTGRQSATGRRSVTRSSEQRRSRGRVQSLTDAKDFLKSLAANALGEGETRVGPKGGVKKSASSCYVAGECGTSHRRTERVTRNSYEAGRPQELPRGRFDVQSSSTRSTDCNREGRPAKECDGVGMTSPSQLEEQTPTAGSSEKFDTRDPSAGRGQLEASPGVNSLAQPAGSKSFPEQAMGGFGGLEGRPAGREPLSPVAQRGAVDSCTSSRNGPSRSDPESGGCQCGNGSTLGRSEPGGVRSEPGDARPDISETTGNASKSHRSVDVRTAGLAGESPITGPSESHLGGLSSRSWTPEPRPEFGHPLSSQTNFKVGDGFLQSRRSEPDSETGLPNPGERGGEIEPPGRSGMVAENAPAERIEGGESEPPGRSGMVAENAPAERIEGGESEPPGRSGMVAENTPAERTENGDAKAGPDEAIVVHIVLRMSEEDHSALLDEWLESRRGEVGGDVMLNKTAVLQKLRTIQDYLCSFEDQGVAVVDVSTTSFAQTLDHLHSHLLDCIEGGWSGADR